MTNVTVDEEYDGNVSLKFTPKVPGAYSIEVKINGDKLPTCPMIVQVKERKLRALSAIISRLTIPLGDKNLLI